MAQFSTIFSSNLPVDCHIIKGRLATEGYTCFIFDEQLIWVHPFKAVAIGGVKIKVPAKELEGALQVMRQVEKGKLIDEEGSWNINEVLEEDYQFQLELIQLKAKIRSNPVLLDSPDKLQSKLLDPIQMKKLIEDEQEFQRVKNKRLNFNWKDFFFELFDFDQDVFKYFRFRPNAYYLDKDLVDKFSREKQNAEVVICPECGSNNTKYALSIAFQWDVLYIILSLIFAPFPPYRRKYHCFDCGHEFKKE